MFWAETAAKIGTSFEFSQLLKWANLSFRIHFYGAAKKTFPLTGKTP